MVRANFTWREVRAKIHQSILEGRFAPGDRLPRDLDIAHSLNCSRSTVQRAMQSLAKRGIVERRRKGGTRVRSQPITRATLDIPIIREEIECRGETYSYQLIQQSDESLPPSVAAALRLTHSAQMLRVLALHLANDRPYIFEDRWLSMAAVPEIRNVDLSRISVNEWLVRTKPASNGRIRLFAETAGKTRAKILDCRPSDALFVIDRTTWSGEQPITTVRASCAPGYQMITKI